MIGSGTIRVAKRDGSAEPLDTLRLAGVIWRAMGNAGRYKDALELARAVGIYLRRTGQEEVSSKAIFEMGLKVLRRARMHDAAEAWEDHHMRRLHLRTALTVTVADEELVWSKSALADVVAKTWHVSARTGRIIAAQVEQALMDRPDFLVEFEEIVDMVNEAVAAFGLADAVPA